MAKAAKAAESASLRITLARSPIGFSETQKRTVKALGLSKMNQSVVRPDNDQVRGMVRAVNHLLRVETLDQA